MSTNIQGQVVVAGLAQGKLLISDEPISFWGGYDQNSGEIIDRRHPLSRENASGCVLALPFSRGSSLIETAHAFFSPAMGSRLYVIYSRFLQ